MLKDETSSCATGEQGPWGRRGHGVVSQLSGPALGGHLRLWLCLLLHRAFRVCLCWVFVCGCVCVVLHGAIPLQGHMDSHNLPMDSTLLVTPDPTLWAGYSVSLLLPPRLGAWPSTSLETVLPAGD